MQYRLFYFYSGIILVIHQLDILKSTFSMLYWLKLQVNFSTANACKMQGWRNSYARLICGKSRGHTKAIVWPAKCINADMYTWNGKINIAAQKYSN